jgi:hypothetical protein
LSEEKVDPADAIPSLVSFNCVFWVLRQSGFAFSACLKSTSQLQSDCYDHLLDIAANLLLLSRALSRANNNDKKTNKLSQQHWLPKSFFVSDGQQMQNLLITERISRKLNPERNKGMQVWYLLVDEDMRFLDCFGPTGSCIIDPQWDR